MPAVPSILAGQIIFWVYLPSVIDPVHCLYMSSSPCLLSAELWLSAEPHILQCRPGRPGWFWQAGSVRQSGRPFMRLHESAATNDKRLIIWDQADLLQNPTPQLSPGRTPPAPAWEKDESERGYCRAGPHHASSSFPHFAMVAAGRGMEPGLQSKPSMLIYLCWEELSLPNSTKCKENLKYLCQTCRYNGGELTAFWSNRTGTSVFHL